MAAPIPGYRLALTGTVSAQYFVSAQKQYVQGTYKGMKMGGILWAWLVVSGSKRVGVGAPVEKADPGASRIT